MSSLGGQTNSTRPSSSHGRDPPALRPRLHAPVSWYPCRNSSFYMLLLVLLRRHFFRQQEEGTPTTTTTTDDGYLSSSCR